MRKHKGDLHDEYGIHLGEMIKGVIADSDYSYSTLAPKLNLTKEGLASKLKTPHYGDTYDLVKISLLLKRDFITPLLLIVGKKGLKIEKVYTEKDYVQLVQENEELRKKVESGEKQISVAYKLIDELENKK